ncbi:Protein YtsP [Vanrija pseudolonga]|uniref:Protein YtsP n=1 Tax=Vanrija pseudolonga TaxID=143232 RepID=A0AAF0Y2J2_9TREE|nr:Protein YtsP [Vanrija pseudolonga]
MPHADSSLVPPGLTTKAEFYAHVTEQLELLLDGHRYWVSNLAQASALLYHSYAGSELYGLADNHTPVVNWVGFYVQPSAEPVKGKPAPLVLGPYAGRPACITISPVAGRGVCADAFVNDAPVVVGDVDAYPGHIACDGDTKSEIVLPLRLSTPAGVSATVGVLDLDSTVLSTFDDEDRKGLEEVVRILAKASDWTP